MRFLRLTGKSGHQIAINLDGNIIYYLERLTDDMCTEIHTDEINCQVQENISEILQLIEALK